MSGLMPRTCHRLHGHVISSGSIKRMTISQDGMLTSYSFNFVCASACMNGSSGWWLHTPDRSPNGNKNLQCVMCVTATYVSQEQRKWREKHTGRCLQMVLASGTAAQSSFKRSFRCCSSVQLSNSKTTPGPGLCGTHCHWGSPGKEYSVKLTRIHSTPGPSYIICKAPKKI